MDMRENSKVTELLHIAFLDVLSKRLEPSRYILKGGANLRYFFDSIRYSEDIDLDLNGVERWALAEKVDAVLESATLEAILRASGISIAETSKPKQTETTQRWKLGLAVEGRDELINTKIEFSGREREDDRFQIEAVPKRIVAPFALRAPSVQHYRGEAMSEQKVLALARRSQTQARDVFDLDLLLRRYPLAHAAIGTTDLNDAAEQALGLPYAAFRDQVLPFLEPEIAEDYDDPEVWTSMQVFVAGELEAR
jgi:predicted nucleotidyltransferase component of viral defense system